MARFPHGGEVLGAAPANPLLAPVLRPGRDLNRQQAMLDLAAIQRIPGLAGYWPADPAYLWEDSAGTIPASVGGVVGAVTAAAPIYTLGSEINTAPTTWTVQTEVTNNGDGSYTFGGTTATRAFYKSIGALTGVLRVSFTVSSAANANIRVTYRGALLSLPVNANGDYVFNGIAGTSGDYILYIEGLSGTTATVSNLSIKQVTSNNAYQATTANKPYLRRTPTSGVYWLDSNTSTSALTATLGNLGSSCTVARAGAEGVTFTEGVTISSTYNIAPAFGFNGDIAIFNRALTATEKALLTRYMQRGVPVLGVERLADTGLDIAASWTVGTNWTVSGSAGTKTAGSAGTLLQSYTPASGSFMAIVADLTVTAGAFNFYVGGTKAAPSITASTTSRYIVGQAAGTTIGINGNAASAGTLASMSFKEVS